MSYDPLRYGARWLLGLALVMLAAHFSARTYAQAPPTAGAVVVDCAVVAKSIESAAVFRDVGADPRKLEAYVRSQIGGKPSPQAEVILREIRRMWAEGLPGAEAAFAFYQRCRSQLGDMGRES